LVIEPDVLLMDEPLGALDRQLRKTVQLELRRLHEVHGRTTIYVTHDQEEALILSDRIGVMHNARIVQVGTAAELYTVPVDAFVAGFIGESNLFPVRVLSLSDGVASVEVPDLARDLRAAASPDVAVDRPAQLLIRPEHIVLDAEDGISGVIDEIVYLGEIISARITLASGAQVWSRRLAISALERGANVRVGWAAHHLRIVAER
jgi:ABC-type Fe3+/spermidine/putrescine transport system ATPase subunit